MVREFDGPGTPPKDALRSLDLDRDYRGLKIIQNHALGVFSHLAAEARLDHVVRRYVGSECYSRNLGYLDSHVKMLNSAYNRWNGIDRHDLFYDLIQIDKAQVSSDPSDNFLTGNGLGQELFAGEQLDQVVGFATANFPEFQKNIVNYLAQQLCRVYFANPEVRVGTATRRRLESETARELVLQQLAQGRLTRGLIPYTESDVETLIRLWSAGIPRRELAAALGRTEPSVEFHIEKFDLPRRRDVRPWTNDEVTDVINLRTNRHLSFAQIGEILLRSEKSVQHKLVEKGVVTFHRKLWTPEEEQRLSELMGAEDSWTTVLEKLSVDFPRGRTIQELKAKAHFFDFGINTEFGVKSVELERLLAEGLTDQEIAAQLSINKSTVGKWKKRIQEKEEADK